MPPIQSIPIHDQGQWQKLRLEDVTASVAGCLLGVHEWTTPFKLFAEKTGKVSDQIEASPVLERGILLEPAMLTLYRRMRPVTHIEWNGTPGEIDGVYLRDPGLRIGATIDARAFDEDRGGRGIVQFKSVEAGIFRRKWHLDDEPVVPLYIAVQAIVEAYLAGAVWAEVAAMVVSHGIEMHILEVPLDTNVFKVLCEKVADFWHLVAREEPPPPNYADDGETIAKLYNEPPDSKIIDMMGDNRLPEILAQYDALRAQRGATETALETIKNEIRFKIGNHGGVICRGYKIKRTHVLAEVKAHTKDYYRMDIRKLKERD